MLRVPEPDLETRLAFGSSSVKCALFARSCCGLWAGDQKHLFSLICRYRRCPYRLVEKNLKEGRSRPVASKCLGAAGGSGRGAYGPDHRRPRVRVKITYLLHTSTRVMDPC